MNTDSTSNVTITLEDLERLASSLEADDNTARQRLERLIKAYARIINAREPEKFQRRATEYSDSESNRGQGSYPPDQEYKAFNGPRLIKVKAPDTSDVAQASGFYYDWKRVTEEQGLYVSRDGRIYGAEHSGTGRFGPFPAHPGDCNVDVQIEWSLRADVSLAELRLVEVELRKQAFPLSQSNAA